MCRWHTPSACSAAPASRCCRLLRSACRHTCCPALMASLSSHAPPQVRTCWRSVTSTPKFWREINLKGRTVQVSKVRQRVSFTLVRGCVCAMAACGASRCIRARWHGSVPALQATSFCAVLLVLVTLLLLIFGCLAWGVLVYSRPPLPPFIRSTLTAYPPGAPPAEPAQRRAGAQRAGRGIWRLGPRLPAAQAEVRGGWRWFTAAWGCECHVAAACGGALQPQVQSQQLFLPPPAPAAARQACC